MYIGMGVMGLYPARSMTVHDNQFCSNTESDQVDLSHCKVLIYSAATLDSKLFMNFSDPSEQTKPFCNALSKSRRDDFFDKEFSD